MYVPKTIFRLPNTNKSRVKTVTPTPREIVKDSTPAILLLSLCNINVPGMNINQKVNRTKAINSQIYNRMFISRPCPIA